MTKRILLPIVLSLFAFGCAGTPVVETHGSANNAITTASSDKQACSVRDSYLKDNATAFKTVALGDLPQAVSDALKGANGDATYDVLATFSVPSLGTIVVAQAAAPEDTSSASDDSPSDPVAEPVASAGPASTAVKTQFLTTKGQVIAVASLAGGAITFATAASEDGSETALTCATQQPDGTGPNLAPASAPAGTSPDTATDGPTGAAGADDGDKGPTDQP